MDGKQREGAEDEGKDVPHPAKQPKIEEDLHTSEQPAYVPITKLKLPDHIAMHDL